MVLATHHLTARIKATLLPAALWHAAHSALHSAQNLLLQSAEPLRVVQWRQGRVGGFHRHISRALHLRVKRGRQPIRAIFLTAKRGVLVNPVCLLLRLYDRIGIGCGRG